MDMTQRPSRTVYFILSCARSGSTSLARILDTAGNGACVCEPVPNLNVESRLADLLRKGIAAYRIPDVIEENLTRISEGRR